MTAGEKDLARIAFGAAIDLDRVWVRRRKWFPLQPRQTVMAPCGHVHFHPRGTLYRDDFSLAPPASQGLFIHELTHVWQSQHHGRWWLPLMRHPFCRYDYRLKEGRPLDRYGIEQQAEIVRHAFLHRIGERIPDDSSPEILAQLLDSVQQRTSYSKPLRSTR